MKTKDVFTPGKYPEVTLIDDHLKEKKKLLSDALLSGGSIISISGPSKSGKTVFIESVIGNDNLISITGAGVTEPEILWKRVFEWIGTPIESVKTTETNHQAKFGGKISAEAGVPFLIKGKGEISTEGNWGGREVLADKKSIDYLQLLIKELKGTEFVLFIDDFHYISNTAQEAIAQQLKEAIRNGVKIICASVPYHSDDVLRANSDLRGRVIGIDFNYWNKEVLCKIGQKGFHELNLSVSSIIIERFAEESAGSPQLMQALCLNYCFELGIYERSENNISLVFESNIFSKTCNRVLQMTDYSSVVDKMGEGPKTRGSDRKSYITKEDTCLDVYKILLKALAKNPPNLLFRYAELISRIESICKNESPSGSSITGACHHMSQICNDITNQAILEWDGDGDVLDIRDPNLLFYLRWNENL